MFPHLEVHIKVNPVHAKMFRGNIKIIHIFLSFLKLEMSRYHGKQGQVCVSYIVNTMSLDLQGWFSFMIWSSGSGLRTLNSWFVTVTEHQINPGSKVHGAHMGPIWGRKDPGGPHVGPMNFAIWEAYNASNFWTEWYGLEQGTVSTLMIVLFWYILRSLSEMNFRIELCCNRIDPVC